MKKTTTILNWIAVVLAAVAFIISVGAYNRAAMDGSITLTRGIEMQVRALQQEVQVRRIQDRLEDLRAQIEANTIERKEIEAELTQIRSDLRDAYVSASAQARESWEAVDAQFAQIEENLRTGAVDFLDALDGMIRNLKRDIQYG